MITSNNSDGSHGASENCFDSCNNLDSGWSDKTGLKSKNFSQIELETFRKPFNFGWKREIVLRSAHANSGKKIVDIYYFSPDKNIKLRSFMEIGHYLDSHPDCDLEPENFTFVRQPIYRPPLEFIRNAISKSTSTFTCSTIINNHNGHSHEPERNRRTQKYIHDTIIKIELCSILGQKLLVRLPDSKFNFSMSDLYLGHEKFCSTGDRDILRNVLTEVNRPRPASKGRITRSNNIVNGIIIPSWGPRHFVHTYTFGKTQRLEKWLTLESGLNWKGRLRELYCRKLKIVAPKLFICPLCNAHIGRLKVHCCSDYNDKSRISTPSPHSTPPSSPSPSPPSSSPPSPSSCSSCSSAITTKVKPKQQQQQSHSHKVLTDY